MQSRRQNRLRREYLYLKNLKSKEQLHYEQKEVVRKAMENGEVLPMNVRRDSEQLIKDLRYDDFATGETKQALIENDEYTNATSPKILLTTSRDPSSRLKMFAKEVRFLFPNTQRVNRGSHVLTDIVDVGKRNGFTDVIVLHETRGIPDSMVVSHLPFGPTIHFTISGVVMRSEVGDSGNTPERSPHVILEGFSSGLGERVSRILQHLFPTAKEDSKRVVSFVNKQDSIIFRHHMYEKVGNEVILKEVGPRFNLMPYMITLDTLDNTGRGEVEWRLKAFTNSAKNKMYL